MALGLTEEHRHLAETVRSWAERNCPPETSAGPRRTARTAAPRSYRASFGPSLAEQGVLGLHLPDDDGGQGFGLPELAVALEELGRALVPGAFLPTVLASAVLSAAGATGKLVVGLADGSRAGAVCLAAGLTGRAAGRRTDHRRRGGPCARRQPWPTWSSAGTDRPRRDVGRDRRERPWRSPRLTASTSPARWPGCARGASPPADRLLSRLDRTAVTSLAAILFGAEASGIADWSVHTAAEYAKIRAAVRPSDRAVPGCQAPVRLDADLGGAGGRRCLGCGAHRAGDTADRLGRVGSGRGSSALRRERDGRARRRRGRLLRARLHPGARRHRLHLGPRGSPLLPARAVAARPARPVRQLGGAGADLAVARCSQARAGRPAGGDATAAGAAGAASCAAIAAADRPGTSARLAMAAGSSASSPSLGARTPRARAGGHRSGNARGRGFRRPAS